MSDSIPHVQQVVRGFVGSRNVATVTSTGSSGRAFWYLYRRRLLQQQQEEERRRDERR